MVLEEHGTYRKYVTGEIIFEKGDETREMYVIDSGEVEILDRSGGQEIRLSVLGPEEIFGEMALFGGRPRSATARALVASGVRVIGEEDIRKLVPDPLARRLLEVMSQRLQDVDSRLAKLSAEGDLSLEQVMQVRESRNRFG
jgi:CRP-like cAMP-binding protein